MISLIILKYIFFIQLGQASSNVNVSDYKAPQLLLRSNINEGFNIGPLSFINRSKPIINTKGDVAIKIWALDGLENQAIWYKSSEQKNGELVYEAPDKRLMTDLGINESGQIIFGLFDEGVTEGLYSLDTKSWETNQMINPDEYNLEHYTYPQIKNNGSVYFRGTDDLEERGFYHYNNLNKFEKIIGEGDSNFELKASYLFKPSVNDLGEMAFKVRFGEKGEWGEERPDQIVILNHTETTKDKIRVIARDVENLTIENKAHPLHYLGFGNTVAINKQGSVAFVGILENAEKILVKSVILAEGNTHTQIAAEGLNDILKIDLNTLKIDDQGRILFKAQNFAKKYGLYLGSSLGIKKIIGEGDEVITDKGKATILSNPNYPAFSTEVDMNGSGAIVFNCLIMNEEAMELGAGIFLLSPKSYSHQYLK